MAKINWKLRLQNKVTVMAIATASIAVASAVVNLGNVAGLWSIKFDSAQVTSVTLNAITVVFGALGSLGIVHDPTTAGVGDSEQALTYTEPKK
ncbi:phage holin [Sporolactobacillus kofuensis]|uniref:Phage holin n=1 Tax=Sporolactobacillus kofuensis TaxID=269672 RepID=A0ABW1WDB2_9BACL|nr:phage holin [Sporolactobacillus kofuensis]MCO7175569.1 phage holin [Sporolactobacillus kofuensis]